VKLLITGAGGLVGAALLELLRWKDFPFPVLAADVREPAHPILNERLRYLRLDVRDAGLRKLLAREGITHVVHLASIVTPGASSSSELEYSVDVVGTQNVVEACAATGVKKLVVSSSGAAYGYHPDNPKRIGEDQPLRGNEEFAYSRHKRLVEELLAEHRRKNPALKQVVLRPGTILGRRANNQITDLFKKPAVLGVRGSDSPFVFIWDEDVAEIIYRSLRDDKEGIYNLAGDGAVTLRQAASILGKPYLSLPAGLMKAGLTALNALRLTRHTAEKICFLRWRPVLDNSKLKEEFGYTPRLSSLESFRLFARHAGLLSS
jgi:UDP-glucose 4-epimerase